MKTMLLVPILCSMLIAGYAEPALNRQERLPAFPGAEGFGRYTTGGRGGNVYHVTTLEDGTSKGTLRYAVNRKDTRTIVFDVAGTIHLKSRLDLVYGNVTIAGQTAPGQGICVADYPVSLKADNIILRYLRFRVGNAAVKDGEEPDGLGGMDHQDIIVDHCSISWSVDECCSVYGCRNLTVQWCMVTESLVNAGHSKGVHGYGGNWGGARVSYHHNLMAHHWSRVPRLGPRKGTQKHEYMDLRNNVFYNWSGKGGGCYGGEGMKVNIVNNYYKPGSATGTGKISYRIAGIGVRTNKYCHDANGRANGWFPMLHKWGQFYVSGNVVRGNQDNTMWNAVTKDNWTFGIYAQIDKMGNDGTFNDSIKNAMHLLKPLKTAAVTTHSAEVAFDKVLAFAGCSKQRDVIDERIVKETRTGTTTFIGNICKEPGLIDSPEDVRMKGEQSPWPALSDGGVRASQLKDSDGDGIPDEWESRYGLNPDDASDGRLKDKSGYTHLEMYMNSLVDDITKAELSNAIFKKTFVQ